MVNDFILVLDLGGTKAIEMARKLRFQRYYTEIMSRRANIELFRRKAPRGILVVGGAQSTEPFPQAILELGVPVLALGSAARHLIQCFGGVSEGVLLEDAASQLSFEPCPLFDGLSESDRYFRRIEGYALPEGFRSIATTMEGYSPAFAHLERQLYGLQFYPESNDPDGATILNNFAGRICGCTPIWTLENYIEEEVRYINDKIGGGRALAAVSGGVDSVTCAMLMKRAIGDRLTCVFIDTGLLHSGEAEQVAASLKGELGMNLIFIDAKAKMLTRLQGITDSDEKQKIIHEEYIDILTQVSAGHPDTEFFVEGTIYPDLLLRGTSDEIYARDFDPGVRLEPIRMLFKDEVRQLGGLLGLGKMYTEKQSFPGTGLANRIMGEVTEEKLRLLRLADDIFTSEILESHQDRRLTRYFALLEDTQTQCRRGSSKHREYACVLRAVLDQGVGTYSIGKLPYDLLERVTCRIVEGIPGINRVTYDLSLSPWAEVEWE